MFDMISLAGRRVFVMTKAMSGRPHPHRGRPGQKGGSQPNKTGPFGLHADPNAPKRHDLTDKERKRWDEREKRDRAKINTDMDYGSSSSAPIERNRPYRKKEYEPAPGALGSSAFSPSIIGSEEKGDYLADRKTGEGVGEGFQEVHLPGRGDKRWHAQKTLEGGREHPVSEAQRRWAWAAEKRGELPEGKAHEWSKRVEGEDLPEHTEDFKPVGKSGRRNGNGVEDTSGRGSTGESYEEPHWDLQNRKPQDHAYNDEQEHNVNAAKNKKRGMAQKGFRLIVLLKAFKQVKPHTRGGHPVAGYQQKYEPGSPEWHKQRIARDTLKMPDAIAGVMGGPSKEQARETLGRAKPPGEATMERWISEGVARATDGCRVEPDGHCPHGKPSWLLEMGMI